MKAAGMKAVTKETGGAAEAGDARTEIGAGQPLSPFFNIELRLAEPCPAGHRAANTTPLQKNGVSCFLRIQISLLVGRPPIRYFSAIGKNQAAHFSHSQPRPFRSERVCFAAIIPGS
jgi:hypothetical protein